MIELDIESKKESNKDKNLKWKKTLYFAVFFMLTIVVILIYFYYKPFNKKISIKEEGYIFWEDNTIEPTLCNFRFEGRFERYLFSNQKNTLVGEIFINDLLVVTSAWTFDNGYALLIMVGNSGKGIGSVGVSEEYDGFIVSIDLNDLENATKKLNEENRCLIITPAYHIEDTLLKWKRYDYDAKEDNLYQWQLDLLNNPKKILARLD